MGLFGIGAVGAPFDRPNFQFSSGVPVPRRLTSAGGAITEKERAALLPTTPETLGLAPTSPRFRSLESNYLCFQRRYTRVFTML